MTHCALCTKPLGRAVSGREQPRIVCAKCRGLSAERTSAAEDAHYRRLREMFETPARIWAEHTMRREA